VLAITLYDFLKFLHVSFAIAWVGGGLMLTILAEFALRSKIPGRAAEFAREAGLIGQRFFAPLALLVLGLGFWLIHEGQIGYPTWIVVGLVGFGLSFVVGVAFLGPQAKQLAKLIEANGPDDPAVRAKVRRIVGISRVDLVILFTVVFFMVTKVGQ
jgi:hypothetical protein